MTRAKILAALLLFAGIAQAQTGQVYSATTPSCENASAYGCATAGWRAPSPVPLLVAAVRTGADCTRRLWDTPPAGFPVLWTKPQSLKPEWCVAYGGPNSFVRADNAALKWPPSTNPTPVNCVGAWGDWAPTSEWSTCAATDTGAQRQSRNERRVYAITTPAANGGTACPFANGATETRVVERDCAMPGPEIDPPTFSRADGQPWTGYVYTNEEVIITWTSRHADSCTGSWSQTPIATSGTARLSYALPMTNAWQSINCVNAFGAYGTTAGFRVLSRAPDCYAHDDREGDRDKVAVKGLSWANTTFRYQVMSVWWCRMSDGTAQQQRFVLGLQDQENIASFRRWLDKQFDEAGVRARCERNCEVLPPGPLKSELDAWAALPENSAAVLGVIEP